MHMYRYVGVYQFIPYLRGRVLIDVVVSEQPFINDPCCPTSAVSIPSPLSQTTGTKVTPAMGVVVFLQCYVH